MPLAPPDAEPLPPIWKRPIPLIIGGAALIAFLLFIQRWREPGYVIQAGPVTGSYDAGIRGSFEIKSVKRNSLAWAAAIPSDRIGGACLAFLSDDLGFSKMKNVQCNKNSECQIAGESEGAYCDVQTKKCWAKPPNADALCDKGHQFPEGVTTIPVATIKLSDFGLKRGSQARVVACLNRKGADPATEGCRSADGTQRIEVMGPVYSVQ